MHHKLMHMKDTLICAAEVQMCDLSHVDAKELGEVIDMIKDLEEAIYYCTITEAMNEKEGYHHEMHDDSQKMYFRDPYYWDKDEWHDKEREHDDEYEGRSHKSRKMYMEAREMKRDKATQLRELEKYMQELTSDIVEMIQDSSPEEKQYLEKKISALASKIGQMK